MSSFEEFIKSRSALSAWTQGQTTKMVEATSGRIDPDGKRLIRVWGKRGVKYFRVTPEQLSQYFQLSNNDTVYQFKPGRNTLSLHPLPNLQKLPKLHRRK